MLAMNTHFGVQGTQFVADGAHAQINPVCLFDFLGKGASVNVIDIWQPNPTYALLILL